MKFQILKQELSYPVVDTLVGTEVVLDDTGAPVTQRVPVIDTMTGDPQVTLVKLDDGGLQLKTVMQDVQVTRDVYEAVPNADAPPDGVSFEIVAWDEQTEKSDQGKVYNFHIGRAVFEHVDPAERASILRKEVEIIYFRDQPAQDQPWTTGLPDFKTLIMPDEIVAEPAPVAEVKPPTRTTRTATKA